MRRRQAAAAIEKLRRPIRSLANLGDIANGFLVNRGGPDVRSEVEMRDLNPRAGGLQTPERDGGRLRLQAELRREVRAFRIELLASQAPDSDPPVE